MSQIHDSLGKEKINDFLVHIFNQVLAIEDKWLHQRGCEDLTMNEIHMLVAIGAREHGAMGEVAKQVSLTNGTVTTMVKRLERKGYVSRTRDEEDRRKLHVRLTERGQAACLLHDQFHDVICEKVWNGLAEAHRVPFLDGLAEIRQILKALDREEGAS